MMYGVTAIVCLVLSDDGATDVFAVDIDGSDKNMITVAPFVVGVDLDGHVELGIIDRLDILARCGVGSCILILVSIGVLKLMQWSLVTADGDLEARNILKDRHWRGRE
jgi:hypothetical protein